jgi:hypothetical protein
MIACLMQLKANKKPGAISAKIVCKFYGVLKKIFNSLGT